jgi:signal transduction histidine kinase
VGHPALGLVDGDQLRDGEWSTVKDFDQTIRTNGTFVLSWDEVFNVIDGDTRRATYVNVPPGRYTFRAMGLAGNGVQPGAQLALDVVIDPPFWQRLWFWPAIASASVAMISAVIFSHHRQRAKRSMEKLRFQNALEKDRARIARDMHDDLGTRVTFINMSAALAQRDLKQAPDNARRHIDKMKESTRELIVAMDDLVWAVDPAFDTLDHLASHLTRLADEMFRDSPIRCRLDIPPLLPAIPLRSELRHHIALAVKESLHNVLCHAGPSEVFFSFVFDGEEILITIRDTGVGFDLESDDRGHGLDNLASRFREIGGSCKITSSPGEGTCIVLSCRVAEAHH